MPKGQPIAGPDRVAKIVGRCGGDSWASFPESLLTTMPCAGRRGRAATASASRVLMPWRAFLTGS
jgi:hypothetical protein